jgi:hypothetical protein
MLRRAAVDDSKECENSSDSARADCEPNSNEIDETDSQKEKLCTEDSHKRETAASSSEEKRNAEEGAIRFNASRIQRKSAKSECNGK